MQVNNGIERLESEVRNVVLEYEVEMERLQKELRSVKESSVTMSKDATEKTEEAQRELLTVLSDLEKKQGEYAEIQSRLERSESLVSTARPKIESGSLNFCCESDASCQAEDEARKRSELEQALQAESYERTKKEERLEFMIGRIETLVKEREDVEESYKKSLREKMEIESRCKQLETELQCEKEFRETLQERCLEAEDAKQKLQVVNSSLSPCPSLGGGGKKNTTAESH